MYLGIDLGTSNSAIVGNDGANLRVFKTAEGTDVLPSAIMIDRRGSILVGKRAYDQAAYSPENVAQGFKRLMGTSSSVSFAARGHDMTPEAASAEILKALVAQARMAAGDFVIRGAVVTIPAAFNQMQTEATMRAAEAAGLERVALLQEPIAAAMASIANSPNKDGHFLVYDLGGGTFDVAIVQSIAGAATVVAHAGINMLGGLDFDRAMVNTIVRPWLFQNFDLADNFQSDPKYERLLRVAQYRAELAKIALSTQVADRIFADESQVGTKDRKGAEIYLDIEVTRTDLDALVGGEIDRSVELCRNLLIENGYQPRDVDKVVMIGGPSRMPVVRGRVASGLTPIPVDLNTDPMTAVAIGAAIYAEGRDWTGPTAVTKKSRGSVKTAGPLNIRFDYPTRSANARIQIKIRVGNAASVDGMRIQAETDDGWSSGQLSLGSSPEIKDVPLSRRGENRIRITVFDSDGSPRADASSELTIAKIEAAADGMPLMHNIAVKVVGGAVGAEKNVLVPIVRKGTLIPKSGGQKFRAARDFRAGDGTTLDFELYEQADGIDDPELNLPIGLFQLNSTNLALGDVIRRGEAIFVNWQIDANGLLNCTIEFESIGQTYDTGKMYVAAAGHKNFDGEAGFALATDALEGARSDIDQLERALGSHVAGEVVALRKRLNRQVETLRLAHEADTRRSVSEEARLIRQDVARLRNKPEFTRAVVRAEIDDFMEYYSIEIAPTIDAKVNTQVNRLAGLAKDVLQKEGPHTANDAKRSFDELRALIIAELAKKPGFWVGMFEDLADRRRQTIDKEKHDMLVAKGQATIAREDIDALRETIGALRGNMLRGVDTARENILAGLML
jgi:molecular chaperone DnaK